MRLLVPILLSGCALETGLTEDVIEVTPGDTGTADIDTAPAEPEPCTVTLAEPGSIAVAEVCEVPTVEVAEPWNAALQWQWAGVAEDAAVRHVITMPAVGNLTDDDGDGAVTEVDIPDIVFIAGDPAGDWTGARSRLVVLDGATGEEHWSRTGFHWLSGVVIADVDGDGESEIVATDTSRHPVVVSADGEIEWTADVRLDRLEDAQAFPTPMVADLWGDGSPEVISDIYILSGATGALQAELTRSEDIPYSLPAIGDLDQDGVQEIVLADRCFSPDGTELWSTEIYGEKGHWSAIIDVDGDPEGEVVMIGGDVMGLYEPDGTVIREVVVPALYPGPPCVADFDGDGAAEVAWGDETSLRVVELDGTEVWSNPITDASGLAGCSGYDVNGDGAYEVLYADEESFTIFDGATGDARYSYTDHTSGTVWEYPVVADIDGDLSAEIVFSSNDSQETGGWAGLTALSHADDGWLASGPTWHVHDFAVTNINADGSVPTIPEPPWQTYNVYRARPAIDRDMAMDLVAEITDICADGEEPDDLVRVAVQLGNRGRWTVPAGIPISVFSRDGASLSFISGSASDDPIPAGTTSAGMELTMLRADLGSDGITVRADDFGAGFGIVEECDESNNGADWSGALE